MGKSLLVVATVFVCGVLVGAGALSPGLEPYTPTRLEWLTLELNAMHGADLGPGGYQISFRSRGNDTVLVLVQYLPNAEREAMNRHAALARQLVSDYAERRDWGWVEVAERVEIIE